MVDLAKDLKDKTQKNIEHLAITSPRSNQIQTLADLLLTQAQYGKTIVFTQTKREADELIHAKEISQKIEALHGDITQ